MNYRSKTIFETTISVDGFGKKPGVVSSPRSISLFAQVGTLKTTLERLSTDQVSGGPELARGCNANVSWRPGCSTCSVT